jgi:hypothetical protein
MKTFQLTISLALLIMSVGACSPKGNSQPQKSAQQLVIAISPSLPDRANSLAILTTWLMHQTNANVCVFDGGDGTQITEFTVPQVKYFRPGAVADRIGAPLQKLATWKQDTIGDARLIGTGALALPELLDRISQSHPAPAHLILIGSPVYKSPNHREFDFAEPRLRSPGFGLLLDEKFPLSCVGREQSFADTRVYYLFPKENTVRWPSSYEANLRRFYGALFAKRGGTLVSFTPDLQAGLQTAGTGSKTSLVEMPSDSEFKIAQWVYAQPAEPAPGSFIHTSTPPAEITAGANSHFVTTPVNDKKESLTGTNSNQSNRLAQADARINVQLERELNVLGAVASLESTTAPPKVLVESSPIAPKTNSQGSSSQSQPSRTAGVPQPKPGVTIVLRYKADSAAGDLYVRPHPDADEISFRQPHTFLGTYNYQFDFESGEHVKSVHLPGGCDPSKAQIWVNYASGFGRLAGRVVWLTPEDRPEVSFSFIALKGGESDHRRENNRRKSEYWQRINAFDFTVGKSAGHTSPPRPALDSAWTSAGWPGVAESLLK